MITDTERSGGTEIDYVGNELELFAEATVWKAYLRKKLAPYVRGNVAEVGAGIGAMTQALRMVNGVTDWTAIEPDRLQFETLQEQCTAIGVAAPTRSHFGTLGDLPTDLRFDTILYIDVLEHIEEDHAEVRAAYARLNPGGRLIVLCPAWPYLFSPFDKAIGHYRRYTKGSLRGVACTGLKEVAAFYLDTVGLFASILNKTLLKQSMPTKKQVALWDKVMVPISRIVDPVTFHVAGKSIVLVWRKTT